jgi:hypothetical protein
MAVQTLLCRSETCMRRNKEENIEVTGMRRKVELEMEA